MHFSHPKPKAVVPRAEAYLTSREKFQNNVRYIRAKEQALIGQAVVCRSNKTGAFYLGAVRDRVSGCRNYLVQWADRSLDIQVIWLIISDFQNSASESKY